nr:hypothetical protein [Tanacetum cinerariifolium]
DVSPGVDGPPVIPKDPYTYVVATFQALPPPDYVPGPEEPKQAPPSPVYIPYIPEPVYPEYIPPPKDDVFPAEEQPLPAAASPTVESPGYIPKSDPDEDPEEDDDDKEEEHPASADSIPPLPVLCIMARISFKPYPPTLSFTKEDAERFLPMPIPPPLPFTPFSSPLPQILSPSLPTSPLSSPHHYLLHHHPYNYCLLTAGESSVVAAARSIEDRRADYGFVDSVEAEIRRRRAEDIGYGIRDTWIDPRDIAEEEPLTTLEGVNTRLIDLAPVQEHDTQDIYRVMEDTHGRQMEIFQRVEALVDDSQYHYKTGRLVDQEARCSREAWAHSIGLSSAIHFEL